jgi:hypothetical protein
MAQNFVVKVVRPQDLLELIFEFVQVDFVQPAGGQPGIVKGLQQSFLAVYFHPQHMAEEAVYENAGTFSLPPQQSWDPQPAGSPAPPPPGSMQARLSGPSRLVFTIPNGAVIPYTLEGLLEAMQALPPNLSPLVKWRPPGCLQAFFIYPWGAPKPPVIGFPSQRITAIEAPYRLILSPDEQGCWEHSNTPVTHLNRTEL